MEVGPGEAQRASGPVLELPAQPGHRLAVQL